MGKTIAMPKAILFLLLNLFGLFNLTAQLTIIVDAIPANTPENDPIHIAGSFQGWEPGSAAYQLAEDTTENRFHLDLPSGTGDIEFKFTRGSWEKVEGDENGNFVPNRFYSGNEGDTLYLQILGWEDLDGNGGGQSTAADNVQILTDSFYMPQFNEYRRVWLYLPPDYHDTNVDYPVLYMHDGQNVFDALTSFVGEWEVDETLNALHAQGDPGIIVVAIDNGGASRIEEYTPWPNPTYGGGQGAAYVEFIVQELKPFIDENYRTLADQQHTGIMGSSLGGLISTFAGIEYQHVFGKIGAFSPSYWFSSEAYNHVSNTGMQNDLRIYQLMGTLEGDEHVQNMLNMEETMISAGFPDAEILSVEKSDGQHSEWFWAREFGDAYLWLFQQNSTSNFDVNSVLNGVHCFPNPTDGALSLSFYLKNAGFVQVDLTDTTGQLIKTIYGNSLQNGNHEFHFNLDSSGLSPGVYFCTIRTREEQVSKRFILK